MYTILQIKMFSRMSTLLHYNQSVYPEDDVEINIKKSNLYSDQSSSSRVDKIKKNTINTILDSYDTRYRVKDNTELNTVNNAITRVRAGGSSVPKKVTQKYLTK